MEFRKAIVTLALLSLPFASIANAHPGRLDGKGGHTCYTNCAKWGLKNGEYHYHKSQAKFLPPAESYDTDIDSLDDDTDAGIDLEEEIVIIDASPEAVPADAIKVKLPSYEVILNDYKINNYATAYPLFEYKGITYIPMTSKITEALGFNTNWDNSTGFSVKMTNNSGVLSEIDAGIPPATLYAKLPQFNVFINDNWVDNSKEEHPLLVLNEVTYIPMTWKFAVEELELNLKVENNVFYISSY